MLGLVTINNKKLVEDHLEICIREFEGWNLIDCRTSEDVDDDV